MASRSSREQFDRQAGHYNAQWNEWSERSLRWILDRAACTGAERVLDVATGTGFTALAFAPHAARVTGLDVSPGMLAQARENAARAHVTNVSFQEGAAEAMPFPDASFDRVTCRVAPHHFLSLDKFATEAHRVLAPGGRLLIADTAVPDNLAEVDAWQNQVEKLRDPSHVRNYSPAEWRGTLESAGFQIEAIELLEESHPMNLEDWLQKSGCTGEPADQVRNLFAAPPADAARLFRIENGSFQWLRVALSARL